MQKIPKIIEIRSTLADNQAVVQYAQGNEKMFLLYIDKKNIVFDSIPSFYSTKKEADKYLILLNRKDLKERLQYIQAASYLYERLIKPFEKCLLDNQNLLVIPAGYLSLIPFDPLLQNYDAKKSINTSFKNLPYLFNRVQIEYSPSWKVWQANSKSEQNRQSFRSAAVWLDTSLPNWQSDKDSLSKIFNNANVVCDFYTGKECSKQHFLRNHKKYDILHLSMHAKTSLMQRRDNKIFFSDRKGDTLYGFDIQGQVYKANLVMLSACETAIGSTEPGEGSYSLTRAFLAGGVPNVVSTMWQVDYQPTSQLIFNFYRGFLREKSVSKALRNSKISYIKQNEEYWTHPGFWAGLINIQ